MDDTRFVVEAPNKISIVAKRVRSNHSEKAGDLMVGVHRFLIEKDGEPVGIGAKFVASEKLWPVGDPEPEEWMNATTTGQPANGSFFFKSPYICDTRFWTRNPGWKNIRNGFVVWKSLQRVKVDVPQCGGGTKEVVSKLLLFQVIKRPSYVEFDVREIGK